MLVFFSTEYSAKWSSASFDMEGDDSVWLKNNEIYCYLLLVMQESKHTQKKVAIRKVELSMTLLNFA